MSGTWAAAAEEARRRARHVVSVAREREEADGEVEVRLAEEEAEARARVAQVLHRVPDHDEGVARLVGVYHLLRARALDLRAVAAAVLVALDRRERLGGQRLHELHLQTEPEPQQLRQHINSINYTILRYRYYSYR